MTNFCQSNCDRYCIPNPPRDMRYVGNRYCSLCIKWFVDYAWCPCCSVRLRSIARNKGKLRRLESEAMTQETKT
jgi:hypothetical protein